MTSTAVPLELGVLEPPTSTPPVAPRRGLRRFLRQQPLGVAAATYLVLLTFAGFVAPVLAPKDPDKQDLYHVLQGPSGAHWLGTDTLGRDVLSRLIFGIEPSLRNALTALVVFLVLGVPIGIVAGYAGGWPDRIISRVAELALIIPPIIFVLVVLVVSDSSPTAAMVTLGVLGSPGLIRVVRGATLLVREELFVTAARVAGVTPARIMTSHILRRVLGPVLVQASLFAGIALAFQAALSFLGLLSQGGRATWGGMIAEASQVVSQTSWPIFPPGVAIALTVLAFGLFGDAVRDVTSGETGKTRASKRQRAASAARAPSPAAAAEPTGPDLGEAAPSGASPQSSATSAQDAVLTVESLQVTAGGGLVLVSDASFEVRTGETVAVVGESGCGKSITALALLGLLPGGVEVTAGSVSFRGTNLTDGGPAAYRKVRGSGIAYIAQDALASLDPTHTVGQHLTEVIGRHEQLSRSDRRSRALHLLRQVKLTDVDRILGSFPHQLSGGMAQRVNIALALAGRPKLLIADEPTTALDVTVQAEILRLLRELQRSSDMSVLIITHDWGVVADIADRAVVMYAGEVVERAQVQPLFSAPRFPYTAALLAADPSTAVDGERLPTLPGRVPAPGMWPTGCRFAGRCAFTRPGCTTAALPLVTASSGSDTRCIRVDDLVREGALPR